MKTGRRTDFSKKNNSGFTLIELVVIAAILAVLAGMIATNIAPMFTQSVRSSAEDLQQLIADTRTATYARADGKSPTCLQLSVADNGRIKATEIVNGNTVTPFSNSDKEFKYLGNYKETLTAEKRSFTSATASSGTKTGSSGDVSLGNLKQGGENLYIAFDKGTGEITCFTFAPNPSDALHNKFNTGDISDAVITLEGNGSAFEVKIDGVTGKSSYKRIY